ncbi:MAG TPA: hypothetical protein VGQ81_09335 [Acidobacteriota bacterium]|nr:hypothetical protein [Acidobacteriota bacterium]
MIKFASLCAAVLAALVLSSPFDASPVPRSGEDGIINDQAQAAALKQKYLTVTDGWAKDAVFKPAEQEAMERGRRWEDIMMTGKDDPLARKVLQAGEPSYHALLSYYPGKILDRTILGSYSDPQREAPATDGSDDEFVIWWNGAVSAHLRKGKLTANIQPLAENTNVLFRVGPSAEMFGKYGERYSRIGYQEGYLPIITARYESNGVTYGELAFADKSEGESIGDIAYVSFQITNISDSSRTAELHEDLILIDGGRVKASGQQLLDPSGALLLTHSGPQAQFDEAHQRLTHRFDLKPNQRKMVYFKIPYLPDSAHQVKAVDREIFESTYRRVRKFWSDRLSAAINIQVPELRINNVWRALVLQNFLLADGPRFTYGSGLRYNDNYYPVENGGGGNVFALYGFADYSHALLRFCMPVSLDPDKAARKYQNRRAVALHHLFENYRLTRKLDVFNSHKDELFRVADEIIADRRSTMVEVNGARPLHWGLLPPSLPAADDLGDKSPMYVVAHDITNCQGLQDFGEFLVRSGVDVPRGKRYIQEAQTFRKTILDVMERSAIRMMDRPPFVELQTLYFRETPGYGPEPYDDLALGRVQGTYYHYWADMELNYNFFNPDDAVARWITDYLQKMDGFVLGCTRARKQSNQPYAWINNVYNAGYYNFMLRSGDIDRFLVGFYSRLAYGMTQHTCVASEGSPFIGYNTHKGGFVSADYSFPNSAANSETLNMLRSMLVLEELKNNVETGDIYLLKGAPRAWFQSGKEIGITDAATYFGNLSFAVQSKASANLITASITPPARDKYRNIIISFRHPSRAPIRRVRVNGTNHRDFDPGSGLIRLAYGPGQFKVEAYY